ncbi:MAG: dimethylamine/trimethylamine dehydrogenase, partial [Parasphingorhabdus sp.]
HADERVLIIGGGPAGLEAACTLGKRGYQVTLAESSKHLGGRINWETRLPGLAEWVRVRDWRITQLNKLSNVAIYPASTMDVETVLELDSQHIIIATGSTWRRDGLGRWLHAPFTGCNQTNVITVEDICEGKPLKGHVTIFDDDHYYLGGALALFLIKMGCEVTLVTPAALPGESMRPTDELNQTMAELYRCGVAVVTSHGLLSLNSTQITLQCVFSGSEKLISTDYLVPITSRIPDDSLWCGLQAREEEFKAISGKTIQRIGDCQAPGIIAAAVYSGHKAARELGQNPPPAKRDRLVI